MKTTKLFSIVLSIILILCCFTLQAAAEDLTAEVSLLGEKQAIVGEEYEVALNVKESTADLIGGIFADVVYDTTKFEFNRVEITEKFATYNHISDNDDLINVNNGKISVMLLDAYGDSADNNWITFVFTVKDSTGSAVFELENVSLSDATGVSAIENPLTVDITNNNVYEHILDVNGASIKKDEEGNIRFEAQLDESILQEILSKESDIVEIGFLMLPTVYIDNGDLVYADKYSSAKFGQISIAKASFMTTDIPSNFDGKFYCYLEQSTTKFKLTTSFSARAFVKTANGTYIYSDNKITKNNIFGGTSSRNCIETAKAIYEIYKSEIQTDISSIIAKNSKEWTSDEYTSVVSALADVADASAQ